MINPSSNSRVSVFERYIWKPLELLVYNSIAPKKKHIIWIIFLQILIVSTIPYVFFPLTSLSGHVLINILYWQALTFFLANLFLPIFASLPLMIIHEGFILALPFISRRIEFPDIVPVFLMLNAVFFLTYAFTKLKRIDRETFNAHMQLLQSKDSKIENLFDNEFYAIIMHDSGRVLDINDTFTNIFGYTRNEIQNLDIAFIVQAKNQNRFLKKLFLYEDFYLEAEGIHKTGKKIPIEIICKSYYEGEQLLQYCFIRDITHLVEINTELEKQKDYLQDILDVYPHALFVVDVDGFTIRRTNKMARNHQQKGYFASLLGSNDKSFQDYAKAIEIIKTTKKPYIFEQEFHGDNGETTYVETHIHPFIDKSGNVEQMVVTAIDISWRKKVEQKLRKALKELEIMQDAVDEHAIVAVTDPLGNITYVNERFLQVSGYTEEELLGKNHRILRSSYHSREFFKNLWDTISSGKVWQGEIKNRAKSGDFYWVFSTIVPFVDESGKPYEYVSIRTDITQQKKTEEELKNAKEEAEKANEAKSTFLANMSHEIRTPLNAVLGLADLTLDTELDNIQKEYLNIIKSSGESLLSLINEILDFSKIEAGKLELDSYDFQLRKIIRSTMHLFFYEAKENNLKMGLDIAPDVPENLVGDPQRIKQILINLLGNAMKFTEKGFIILHITVNNRYSYSNEIELKFAVIDSGIGISDEKRELIFESFTQEDSSTTRKYGGTGLGTTISKELAKQMGGEIGVVSPPPEYKGKVGGKGSMFWFTIRVKVNMERTEAVKKGLKALNLRAATISPDSKMPDWLYEYTKDPGIKLEPFSSTEDFCKHLKVDKYDFCIFTAKKEGDVGEVLKSLANLDNRTHSMKILCILEGKSREPFILKYSKEIEEYLSADINKEIFLNVIGAIFIQHPEAELIIGGKDNLIKKQKYTSGQIKNIRILVAEDNEVNQLLVKTAMERKGYKVTLASNGQEALDLLAESTFDIIFMDLQMPVMNGFEASRLIRKNISKTIPIIAVTANAFKEDKDKSYEAGMNAFIAKPYKANDLVAAIHEWVYPKD